MPILSKIIDKHGDIAKNCKESMEYRSMLLDRICRIVYELDKKNVTNIKDRELEKQIVLVDDIKSNEVEVKWLHTRLTEIREAISPQILSNNIERYSIDPLQFLAISPCLSMILLNIGMNSASTLYPLSVLKPTLYSGINLIIIVFISHHVNHFS
jgi:hypothetical protein